jgi:translation initiation factor IF-1
MNGGEGRRRETVEGVIEEALPNALFRVRLSSGRTVNAGASTDLRRTIVRLIPGTQVLVELSLHDPNRGNIIQKL